MMRLHTDRIESVEGLDLDHDYDLPSEINYDVMDQEEYANTILINSDVYADFEDWYDDSEAEVLVIWIQKGCEVYEQTPADRIKELRKLTGLSQTAFGKKYGIPMRTIQNWENGVNEAPGYVEDMLTRIVWEDHTEEITRWMIVDATSDMWDAIEAESKEDALSRASLMWQKMSSHDQKRRTEFYVGLMTVESFDTCVIARKWV